ncbi:MAG: Rid family detoxifying hydrolase [Bacteroidota bacterium]
MISPVFVPGAPEAVGPYAHATQVGALVFCSGQGPVDPATGALVAGDVRAQTRRVLANLALVLEGQGLTLHDVAKTTVFLKDMRDFAGMNDIYAEVFGPHRPARSTVAVREIPLDALVEIECIAVRPE